MVCSSDAVAIIRIVILDEIPVDGFRHRSRYFSLTGKLCFENLPCEVSLIRLEGTRRKPSADISLQASYEVLVAFARHDRQHVDLMNRSRVVHAVAVLVHGEPHTASNFLPSGNGVVAVL